MKEVLLQHFKPLFSDTIVVVQSFDVTRPTCAPLASRKRHIGSLRLQVTYMQVKPLNPRSSSLNQQAWCSLMTAALCLITWVEVGAACPEGQTPSKPQGNPQQGSLVVKPQCMLWQSDCVTPYAGPHTMT